MLLGEVLFLLPLVATAWSIVACWYFVFGIVIVPYRLSRRSNRKQNLEQARHEEMLALLRQAASSR